jgi:hypothetical protein
MKTKYPRTPHFPFSLGRTNDDKTLKNCDHFQGKDVVVTAKLDGENSTLTRDYYHARSLDSRDHWSRSWIKKFHSEISYKIPIGIKLCGENLYAKHSIQYENLKSYFYLFNVWYHDLCYSWDETVEIAELLDLVMVPVLFRGTWDEDLVKNICSNLKPNEEGVVVRCTNPFIRSEFTSNVAKYVRADHVQTDEHWMYAKPEINLLTSNE